jgi:hypothetical protein
MHATCPLSSTNSFPITLIFCGVDPQQSVFIIILLRSTPLPQQSIINRTEKEGLETALQINIQQAK